MKIFWAQWDWGGHIYWILSTSPNIFSHLQAYCTISINSTLTCDCDTLDQFDTLTQTASDHDQVKFSTLSEAWTGNTRWNGRNLGWISEFRPFSALSHVGSIRHRPRWRVTRTDVQQNTRACDVWLSNWLKWYSIVDIFSTFMHLH